MMVVQGDLEVQVVLIVQVIHYHPSKKPYDSNHIGSFLTRCPVLPVKPGIPGGPGGPYKAKVYIVM